ncbi:putative reverse transcriptase domain-containing protein [Tanacetum coccineum]
MSDSKHSTITYTSVSIPFEDDSDMGSPGVDGPPSPDYVPGPEEPEQAPPSPVYLPYVPEPVYPEYIPPEDDVFLAEEDPEEDDEEDPEEDPADYPADRRDDDDDDDEEEDEEEEEEHLAPADYTVVSLPAVDHIPSRPLPIPSPPPPNIPTHIEVPESCLPLWKRLCLAAPTPNHEVGESSAVGAARQDGPAIAREDPYSLDYGITDTWDDLETTIMYGMIEDAQDDQSLLRSRVKQLYRDRPVHRRLAVIIKREARMSCKAWGLSMDASDYARSDVMSLRTTIVGQRALISELQSADHMRHGVIKELLAANHQRQVQLTKALKLLKGLQTQMAEFQRQHRPAKGNALTWWNSHVKNTTPEAAHAMPWRTLKKMMTAKYCPRGEIKKLEFEMWIEGEGLRVEDNTWLNVSADHKRQVCDTLRNNRESASKQRDKTTGWLLPQEKWNPLNVNTRANQRGNVCFKCGAQGHFKKDCPKLKNNNRGNRVRNAKAQAKVLQ